MTLAVPDPAPNVRKKYRGARLGGPHDLHLAWRILAGNAPEAAAALVDVAKNGTVPGARVAAAKTILEMTGFRSADTVQVLPPEHDQAAVAVAGDSPTARIHHRMEALRGKAHEPAAGPSLDDLRPQEPDVIDAEPDQG